MNNNQELTLLRKELSNLRKTLELKNQEIAELRRNLSESDSDSLTGLANRSALLTFLNAFIQENKGEAKLSLIMIDIDMFKKINDAMGHQVGDTVLKQFAGLLKDTANFANLIARIGSDKFLLALCEPISVAFNLAEMIRTLTESKDSWVVNTSITVSIGVAQYQDEKTAEQFLKKVDTCMYAAKSEGRNCIVTDSDLNASAEETGEDIIVSDLENRIRVMTDRLTSYLMIRSRDIVYHYKNEAIKDGLTGIYNRGYLDRLIDRELKKAKTLERSLAVAMVDLDNFGKINKDYNWIGGDQAIITTAHVIQNQIRANDWVARYGGDEILVVMPDTELSTAGMVAERIRKTLEDTLITVSTKSFHITASIGVAEYDPKNMDLQTLYGAAGKAARQAKKEGKNRVVVH
jgi:diguanylate cyclase (GGDEF)-like protein